MATSSRVIESHIPQFIRGERNAEFRSNVPKRAFITSAQPPSALSRRVRPTIMSYGGPAALQPAIWEAAYDSPDNLNLFSLANGRFRASGTGAEQIAAIALATLYLQDLGPHISSPGTYTGPLLQASAANGSAPLGLLITIVPKGASKSPPAYLDGHATQAYMMSE
jgi:hypothetical protein